MVRGYRPFLLNEASRSPALLRSGADLQESGMLSILSYPRFRWLASAWSFAVCGVGVLTAWSRSVISPVFLKFCDACC